MSLEVLLRLQREHAFDPAPVRQDLAAYHVPFSELADGASPEDALLNACVRFERCALVGDSGSGKSSLMASVLGPLTENIAPIVVPVARESYDLVREPAAMFRHLVNVIGGYAEEARLLDERERAVRLGQVTSLQPVGKGSGRSVRLSATWMGAGLGAELVRQRGSTDRLERSATSMLEVVHQMMELIHRAALVPVLVFDDTDRWLRNSAYAEPETLVATFFGRVLPELRGLSSALVVAVHRRYLADESVRGAIGDALETRVDIPAVGSSDRLGRVLMSRVRAHMVGQAPPIEDVCSPAAVDRLYEHYRQGLRNELRGVMRTVHTALAAACDSSADCITAELIDDGVAEWED